LKKAVLIPEFDEEQMATGFMWATKVDEYGPHRGLLPVSDVADAMAEFFKWDAADRQVQLISRLSDSPFIAIGQNGGRWVAIKAVEPGDYTLNTVTGLSFQVKLPRMIARVTNFGSSFLFWTEDQVLTADTKIYPMVIGNISSAGWICIGTTGITCKSPGDIDQFVRKVVEARTTGTYLPHQEKVEAWFQTLTEKWDDSVGNKHGITLKQLIDRAD
jgi:hypothetical protein